MWMMSYNDGEEFNMPDSSFNGRKLRTLIPRPATVSSANNTANANSQHLSHFHSTDVLALNHHWATVNEQCKKEINTQQVVVSSRWNPTPEQLNTLEELYRRGTRTPSAHQIQHITAQLRPYGKIEGKNVFYWFQNHKARERQKRRRRQVEEQCRHNEIIERKSDQSEANRTDFEVEQTKNWPPPIYCSTLSENTVPIQRAAKAAVPEFCRADGWVQLTEGELQHRRSIEERNATWQMMQLSCCPLTHFINSTTITSTATTKATATPAIVRTMEQKPIKAEELCIPYRDDINHFLSVGGNNRIATVDDRDCGEYQTLQLFPLRRGGDGNESVGQTEVNYISTTSIINTNCTPYQFFEFLPLKN